MLDFCLGSISDEIETAPRLPLTDPIPDISDGMIVLRRSGQVECPFPEPRADIPPDSGQRPFVADSCLWCSGRPNDRSGSFADLLNTRPKRPLSRANRTSNVGYSELEVQMCKNSDLS
jgi:hypothetical protein